MAKILLTEDDGSLAGLVVDWLRSEGHTVDWASCGADAVRLFVSHEFDVMVLDLELPDMTGIQVLQEYRGRGGTAPVLILTAQKKLSNKLEGFSQGADDYLTKPFEPEELSARLEALMRRPPLKYSKNILVGQLELDPVGRTLRVKGQIVDLDPIEFSTIEFFMRNTNQVFSQGEIVERVWPPGSETSAYAVSSCIKRLRRKIDPFLPEGSALIRTVYGAGYCLDE